MVREVRTPRPDWKSRVETLGLVYHTVDGEPYWNEAAAYRFDAGEIEQLEASTNELHEMCLQAVEHLVQTRTLGRLGIPERVQRVIEQAWEADPPAIYGRFDLAYHGTSPPKLLEYNADTPTSLLEAAVIQWHWLQEVRPDADQFNSIWEGLTGKWKALRQEGFFEADRVHFAGGETAEDLMTIAVLIDTACEAKLRPVAISVSDISWDEGYRRFCDPSGEPIKAIFKLYPWEWMLEDDFGDYALETYPQVSWIEPIWKMVLSNKAILAILWELFPGHPSILPAYLDGPHDMDSYVRKPYLGREGANVTLVAADNQRQTDGPYGAEGFVYQSYASLPIFDGNHALVGSWVVDGEARGIGIRESSGPITDDLARFVPHYFFSEAALESRKP